MEFECKFLDKGVEVIFVCGFLGMECRGSLRRLFFRKKFRKIRYILFFIKNGKMFKLIVILNMCIFRDNI